MLIDSLRRFIPKVANTSEESDVEIKEIEKKGLTIIQERYLIIKRLTKCIMKTTEYMGIE